MIRGAESALRGPGTFPTRWCSHHAKTTSPIIRITTPRMRQMICQKGNRFTFSKRFLKCFLPNSQTLFPVEEFLNFNKKPATVSGTSINIPVTTFTRSDCLESPSGFPMSRHRIWASMKLSALFLKTVFSPSLKRVLYSTNQIFSGLYSRSMTQSMISVFRIMKTRLYSFDAW